MIRIYYEIHVKGKLYKNYCFEKRENAVNLGVEIASEKGSKWVSENNLTIKKSEYKKSKTRQRAEVRVINRDGVTYVGKTVKVAGTNKSSLHLKSKWLSRQVYLALKESNLYGSFMAAHTLEEAGKILNKKQGGYKKRR